MKKIVYRITNIILIINIVILLPGCFMSDSGRKQVEISSWREEAPNIYTYDYYNSHTLKNDYQGISNLLYRPYVVKANDDVYIAINDTLYKGNQLAKICDFKDRFMVVIGATDKYLYTISSIGAGYTLYRYSFEDELFSEVYSSKKEEKEYGFDTISKSAWIDGNDCLLTTLKRDANNVKREDTALYVFSDDDEYERYEVTDDTVEINDKYMCHKAENIQFITDIDYDWFAECDGTNDNGNVIACNGKVFESGQVEPLAGYEIGNEGTNRITGYTWYIQSYEDKAIFFVTGGKYYQNHYSDVINTSTENWRYDAIDIYDTTLDERYTLYEDGTNRIIGYDPEENRVFIYVYSDNTLISKDLDDDTLVSLESFEEAAAISFVWEGKDLFYFYGTGDDMRYGGIIDVAK